MNKQAKYQRIYEDVKRKLLSGVYPIGSKLEDGNSLVHEYGVSLMTVKKALDMLAAEGFLIRRRGDGTIVQDWTKGKKASLYAVEGSTRRNIGKIVSKILHFEVERASVEIAEKLSVDENEFVYNIARLRVIDNVPSIMEYTYMPISIIPNLKYEHLLSSIYDYIQRDLGLSVYSSFLNVRGLRPNELEKEQMGLTDTDFLLQIEQVANLDDGRIFEYSIARHLPEEFRFETVVFNQ
ncbi:MAG: GntR family transcriptional regulator [Streptococcaceae bacterium]|jgi:DNA-binding GntR family transcriptional regulator|nr:GntR family transcriptional regulator [Streptococcaceae bacterium]